MTLWIRAGMDSAVVATEEQSESAEGDLGRIFLHMMYKYLQS